MLHKTKLLLVGLCIGFSLQGNATPNSDGNSNEQKTKFFAGFNSGCQYLKGHMAPYLMKLTQNMAAFSYEHPWNAAFVSLATYQMLTAKTRLPRFGVLSGLLGLWAGATVIKNGSHFYLHMEDMKHSPIESVVYDGKCPTFDLLKVQFKRSLEDTQKEKEQVVAEAKKEAPVLKEEVTTN